MPSKKFLKKFRFIGTLILYVYVGFRTLNEDCRRSLLQFGGSTFFRSQIQPHNIIEDEFNSGLL